MQIAVASAARSPPFSRNASEPTVSGITQLSILPVA